MEKIIFTIVALVCTAPIFAQNGLIEVTVRGIQNTEGTIEIGVYDHKSSFLIYGEEIKGARIQPTKKGSLQYIFENLPDGTYAVAVWHDVNANRKIDKNIFGVPKEPYGFSKNVFGPFGPPNFENVSFQIVN
ncbi:MAG: hypothetical protein ACJAXY_002527, partial [Nonlabens sp.]